MEAMLTVLLCSLLCALICAVVHKMFHRQRAPGISKEAPLVQKLKAPVRLEQHFSRSNSPSFHGNATGNTFNFSQTTIITGTQDEECATTRAVRHRSEQKKETSQDDVVPTAALVAGDQCEAAMKARYTNTGSYVHLLPWIGDDTKHITEIYTKLELDLDCQDAISGRVACYHDIFLIKTREGQPVRRVVLNGWAGLGKSTLVDKIAYDWAVGSAAVLKKFKLAFVLKMHALTEATDLIDAVFDQLLDNDTRVSKPDLKAFMDIYPEKVLILLDGFDEFKYSSSGDSSFGSVLKTLNRREGRELTVVVTTRPSHLHTLLSRSLIEKPVVCVKVLGFAAEDTAVYVRKFLVETADQADALLEKIRSSDTLSDLAKSPMLLLLMCLLWRGQHTLPDTMSRLYEDAVRFIFKRKAELSPDEMTEEILALGEIAFHGLLSPLQSLSFQEGEFEKSVLDVGMRAGILTSQRVLKGLESHFSVQFIHKTFQEFCAAKFCQRMIITGGNRAIFDSVDQPCHIELLLRFCCGGNETCARAILDFLHRFITGRPGEPSHKLMKLILNCFFEGQSKNVLSTKLIHSVLTRSVGIFGNDHLYSFIYLARHVIGQSEVTGMRDLARVRQLQVDWCSLHRFGAGFSMTVGAMSNLTVLRIVNCFMTGQDVANILKSLSSPAKMKELYLLYGKNLSGTIEELASSLRRLVNLTHLTVGQSSLTLEDAKCLAGSMGCMMNLEECSVDVGFGWMQVWQFSSGIELHLRGFSLTGDDLADFVLAFSFRSDLLTLSLRDVDGLGGTASAWSHHLQNLRHLQELVLCKCRLRTRDIVPIATTVRLMPRVGCLNLKGNNLVSGTADKWASSLEQLKHVRKLDFSNCSLTNEDKSAITQALSVKTTFLG